MIYTSYFAKSGKEKNSVSIALSIPPNFYGERMIELAPSMQLLRGYKDGKISIEEYTKEYNHKLSMLDPKIIGKYLEGKILLCWEHPEKFCHRHLVAQWLKDARFQVKELGG